MFNPIEKWKAVLESDLGDQIPSTGIAISVAISLELQTIENNLSNRVPEAALKYAQYFLPMIRRCSSIACKYNYAVKEINDIEASSNVDDIIIKRDILKLPITEIHATLAPRAKFNLTKSIASYTEFIALGDAYQNLVQNKIMAFVISNLKKNATYGLWYLRCEMDGDDIYVYLMTE